MTEGFGPYESWNFGLGRDYAPPSLKNSPRYLTAVAELEPAKVRRKGRRATGARKIWLPTLWNQKTGKRKPFTLRFIPFVIGKSAKLAKVDDDPTKLRKGVLGGLGQSKFRRYLQSADIGKSRFRIGLPVSKKAMKPKLTLEPADPRWQPDPGLHARIGDEKRITIFAVIDDGLPFAHRNFRNADGDRTRVEFCWLQSAEADARQRSVLFGREYTRGQIDEYIKHHGDDEDALYRAAGATADTEGLASMIRRHTTHGAHVMDLATGYARERGEEPAEEIRIIAVQLPNVVTMDTSGVGKDMYLLSAFHYIFHRADVIAAKYKIDRARLVINFSYGYFGGPHDGQFDVEAAIDQLVERRRETVGPTALVLPAGNSFLDRMHASIPEGKFVKHKASIRWRLQPNDRTPNFLEFWFPGGFNPIGYTVTVLDASGSERGSLSIGLVRGNPDRIKPLLNHDEKSIGQISVDRHRGKRWRVFIVTEPGRS